MKACLLKEIIFFVCLFFLIVTSLRGDGALKHKMMIEKQIVGRGISDAKVLAAMKKVERHLFVGNDKKNHAYEDHPLPIGWGQTISQPYIVALMTELINPQKDDIILEIGTGSGYQAAILGELAKEVYSIEIVPELAKRAKILLDDLAYKNIFVIEGDGYKGYRDKAPYDKIIVTAAPPSVPEELFSQLKEGGIMVVPVGGFYQELLFIKKIKGKMVTEIVTGVRFVPMIHG